MPYYVYSTATGGVNINIFAPMPKSSGNQKDTGPRQKIKTIAINGGANVAHQKTLVTRMGVITKVDDEDMELLMKNRIFQRMVDRGFFKIEKKKVEVEKAITAGKGMKTRDASAPETDETLAAKGAKVKADAEKKKKAL